MKALVAAKLRLSRRRHPAQIEKGRRMRSSGPFSLSAPPARLSDRSAPAVGGIVGIGLMHLDDAAADMAAATAIGEIDHQPDRRPRSAAPASRRAAASRYRPTQPMIASGATIQTDRRAERPVAARDRSCAAPSPRSPPCRRRTACRSWNSRPACRPAGTPPRTPTKMPVMMVTTCGVWHLGWIAGELRRQQAVARHHEEDAGLAEHHHQDDRRQRQTGGEADQIADQSASRSCAGHGPALPSNRPAARSRRWRRSRRSGWRARASPARAPRRRARCTGCAPTVPIAPAATSR